jgi:Flp pilus assembly protein TadB
MEEASEVDMAEEQKRGAGGAEIAAVAVIVIFVVVVVFGFMDALVGAIWWTFKLVVLIAVLTLVIRWLFRRVTR